MRRNILFDGYYGMQNSGDDVFCVVAADLAARTGNVRPGFMADRLPALPTMSVPVLAASPGWKGGRRYQAVTAAARHRRVVHLGGSTLRRLNTHRRDQQALARVDRRLELHAAGVSVGPFRSTADEAQVKRYLQRFQSLAVRDASSAERARALGLEVVDGFDVAVVLPEIAWAQTFPVAEPPEDGTQVLGVSVCPVESEGASARSKGTERVRHLAAAVHALAGRIGGVRVRVLQMNGHPRRGDAELSHELVAALLPELPAELVPYHPDIRETVTALRQCHGLIGMRLHSAILAYAYEVPFALVDYHPKCREFAETIGLDGVRLLASAVDDADALQAAMLSVLDNPGSLRARLAPVQARALAVRGLEHLTSMLREGRRD